MRVTLSKSLALGLLLAVAACAQPTVQAYEAQLEQFVGRPVDELAMSWGPPQGTFTMADGNTVMEYSKNEGYSSGSGTTVGLGGFSSGGSVGTGLGLSFPLGGGGVEPKQCKTRFIVSPDRIVKSWGHEGNACTAYAPKPTT
jgi:hypothetical protein